MAKVAPGDGRPGPLFRSTFAPRRPIRSYAHHCRERLNAATGHTPPREAGPRQSQSPARPSFWWIGPSLRRGPPPAPSCAHNTTKIETSGQARERRRRARSDERAEIEDEGNVVVSTSPRRGDARRTNAPIRRPMHMNAIDGSIWYLGHCGTAGFEISRDLPKFLFPLRCIQTHLCLSYRPNCYAMR